MKKRVLLSLLYCLSGISCAFAQYCLLPGRTPYSTLQPGITNFQLNTINRTSGNSESTSSVVVNTGLSTTLTAGQTYTISISHSEDTQYFVGDRNNLRVWIDYNKNFSYTNSGETVLSQDLEAPGTTYTASFTVPLSIPSGTTSLRATAKMSSDAGHTLPTPCDSPADALGYHGEMEDYTVVIENPGFPLAGFDISSTVCVASSATVNNTSTGAPIVTYSWVSNPSSGVTFNPNTTAANPQIIFSNSGTHTITCLATNSISSNSSNKIVNVSNCNFVGVSEHEWSDQIKVSPNPSSGLVKIQVPVSTITGLVLTNYLGQAILEKKFTGNDGTTLSLDLSEVKAGIYFIKVTTGAYSVSKRLILEK